MKLTRFYVTTAYALKEPIEIDDNEDTWAKLETLETEGAFDLCKAYRLDTWTNMEETHAELPVIQDPDDARTESLFGTSDREV